MAVEILADLVDVDGEADAQAGLVALQRLGMAGSQRRGEGDARGLGEIDEARGGAEPAVNDALHLDPGIGRMQRQAVGEAVGGGEQGAAARPHAEALGAEEGGECTDDAGGAVARKQRQPLGCAGGEDDVPGGDGDDARRGLAAFDHHLVHPERRAGNGEGFGAGEGGDLALAVEAGDQPLDGGVGRGLGIDGAEIADGAAQALGALDQHGAFAGGRGGDGGAEPGDAAADNGEIGLDGFADRGIVPGRRAGGAVAEAMVQGAGRAEQPVAQGTEQATRGDRVAPQPDGDEVEAGEGRGALHRQGAALAGRDQRGEVLVQRQGVIAMPAGNLDAGGDGGRQHGVAQDAFDASAV